jgi:mediator of RNA polymerase II transcription subunit 31
MCRSHPGPTLRALELLQQERFRTEIVNPSLFNYMTMEGLKHALPAANKD